jgi:hypothetical protein
VGFFILGDIDMSEVEHATSQIILNKGVIVAEGAGTAPIWVTPSRAKFLIEAGAATPFAHVSETKAGPTGTKPTSPKSKKRSAKK